MTVEIETSRAISAQILRHRSFCFQEFSQRYAEVQEFEYIEPRRQDVKNRQNSFDDLKEDDIEWFEKRMYKIQTHAQKVYNEALKRGIAKECARFALPMNVSTKLYMTGNLRSWIHYLNVRTDPSTQKEHRDIAEAIKQIFINEFPIVSEALNYGIGQDN